MTIALPEPDGCVWCGQPAYRNASSCIECGAALAGDGEPGSVVRNATFLGDVPETRGPILRTPLGTVYRHIYRGGRVVSYETLFGAKVAEERVPLLGLAMETAARIDAEMVGRSVVADTARERRVHDGGPRILGRDLDTGATWGDR